MNHRDRSIKNFKKERQAPLPKRGKKFPRKEKNPALIALLKDKYEKYLFQCRTIH